jgi:energy-coupling factor transporter transmembrane protein EcfT
MRAGMLPLGTAAHSWCLVSFLALAILTSGLRSAVALAVIVVFAAVAAPSGLSVIRSARVWLFVGLLLLPMALLAGERDMALHGVRFSSEGLETGAQMAVRALSIIVAAGAFATSVSVGELAGLLERAGIKGVGFALGVGVNMLPTVQQAAATTWEALRLRGGFRRRRLAALRLLLVTVVVNSLRHADDIVCAAEARAFSVVSVRPLPLTAHHADIPVCAAVLAAALSLLLA